MMDDTKRRIILENSWVYLKGTQCFVSEDPNISQQNAPRKTYEEKLKFKVKDVLGDLGNRDNHMIHETKPCFLRLYFWNCNGYPWNAGFGTCVKLDKFCGYNDDPCVYTKQGSNGYVAGLLSSTERENAFGNDLGRAHSL